jgi:hypothetical protein
LAIIIKIVQILIKRKKIMKIAKGLEIRKEPDILRYTCKNTDLNALTATICKWFKDNKYATQMLRSENQNKWLVQARKKNIWRACTASAREIAVVIEGDPNDFTILVRPSKWINNMTSLAVLSLLSMGAFLPFCGIAAAWIIKIRKDLKEFIELRIDFIEKATA